MTIRPIDFNGMIQRTNDVSQLKQQEDAKPLYDQQNIQVQFDKKENEMLHKVVDANASDNLQNNADAKDEGKNKYYSNKKKNQKKQVDGKVVKKNQPTSFDIKI